MTTPENLIATLAGFLTLVIENQCVQLEWAEDHDFILTAEDIRRERNMLDCMRAYYHDCLELLSGSALIHSG